MDSKEMSKEEAATQADLLMDLKLLRSGFTPTPDNELSLDSYIGAYLEMNKFLGVLGPIFNMVTSEVETKVKILQEHRKSEDGDHYTTVNDMLSFEQKQAHGGVPGDRRGQPSGARTLLRLHRALEFVREFLLLIMRPREGFFGGQVSRLYGATLGKYHSWLIRTTTSTALFTMPAHATIMQRLTKGKTEVDDSVREEMDQVIAAMKDAYDLTHKLYQQYGYLDLP
ncbi:hypothetical protein O3P69_005133 [Scylla paramamosain]|uniref:Glycolipid transfer protein domain-containing protein n=1 Tax=Scylla paramamosain TaxID=85552 RepID=A0AAW0UA09_SCYPA